VTTSKRTRNLKHTNSILEYFEYLCQMSNVIKINHYYFELHTVSNVVRFMRHSVE